MNIEKEKNRTDSKTIEFNDFMQLYTILDSLEFL